MPRSMLMALPRCFRPASLFSQDETTQVQFWKVLLCHNESWTPGALEAAGLAAGEPYQDYWPKYRNMRVR